MKRSTLQITLHLCTVTSIYSAPAVTEELGEWRTKTNNSPGVVFALEETARTTLKDGTPEVTYRLSASGFPQGKTYSLWFERVGEKPKLIVNKLFVDESGAMIVKEFKPDTDVPFLPAPMASVLPVTVDHFQPGEPVSLSLISEDEEVKGHAKDFPIPIEDRDGSCHLYLELITPDRTAFAAWGAGFVPSEEVLTESRSGDEVIKSTRQVENDGGFLEILFPQTVRKKYGTASFSVTGETCSATVEYEWGSRRQ